MDAVSVVVNEIDRPVTQPNFYDLQGSRTFKSQGYRAQVFKGIKFHCS
jgi:hypothetical protein